MLSLSCLGCLAGAKAQAVADICQRLAAMPVPVLAAASRALATPATTATTNTQQPAAAATASSGAAAKLLPVVMQVIQASQLQAGTASSQPQPMVSTGQTQPRQLFWAWFVRLVLTQPGFAAITDAQVGQPRRHAEIQKAMRLPSTKHDRCRRYEMYFHATCTDIKHVWTMRAVNVACYCDALQYAAQQRSEAQLACMRM